MNTEEAIKIISNYGVFGCGYCHQGDNEVEESFDMAIKALENSRWIPCSERLPNKGQYVLVSTDENRVITATFEGDYWGSVFDLDWEEVLAWMPLPKPYEGNHGFSSKEGADLWMDGKPAGKEEI